MIACEQLLMSKVIVSQPEVSFVLGVRIQVYLLVMAPGMITVADPGAVEHVTLTAGLDTSMGHWVVVCVTVLTAAAQDPAAFCRDEKEGLACTFCMTAPAH